MRFAAICLVLLAIAAIDVVMAEDQSVPDGTIYGHVYDAKTKQPVSGAWVYCQETKCPKQLTGSIGYYAIENCFSPSSTYVIECAKNGYPTAKNTAQTDSNGKAEVDFNLELISAEGAVTSQSGIAGDLKVEAMPNSGKVSGTGSLKKEYQISNEANDYANVSVDIKNATYYEYNYSTYSDETQSLANLDLVVKHAESITCSGGAKNRNNVPSDITTLIKNGDLRYNNSVIASDQGVQASQSIIETNGDNINVNGKALGDNNIILANIINAYHSEGFNGTQKVSAGGDTSTYTNVNAIAGPLGVESRIAAGGRTLDATANVIAGVASINQSVNLTDAYQTLNGVTGGSDFNISIETANGKGSYVHATAGSGNLIQLLQRASATGASYEMEYEYMPVSYSTGTYDTGYASGGSEVRSDKIAANDLLAGHCEHLQVTQETNLSNHALTQTSLNGIAGPLDVESYIAAGDRTLNATADVVAGVVSIDQSVNLNNATQACKGVAGGSTFNTAIMNADRKTTRAYTTLGSGNIIDLAQLASLEDAWYKVEYEYMPVSYQTGTYDTDLNTSRIER